MPEIDKLPGIAPSDSQETLLKRLERRHPVWEEGEEQWGEIEDVVYDGVRRNLDRYLPRGGDETPNEYLMRRAFARFKGEMPTVLNRIVGAVLAKPPRRPDTVTKDFEEFFDDCDGCGKAFDAYIEDALFDSLAFGADFSIVDLPEIDIEAGAAFDQTSKGFQPEETVTPFSQLVPRLVKYRRHQLVDWDHDSCGEFHWIRVMEKMRRAPTPEMEPLKMEVYTEWDRIAWRKFEVIVLENDRKVVRFAGSGFHNLGVVPIAMLWSQRSTFMRFEPFIKYSYHHDIEQFQSDADLRYNLWKHGGFTLLDGRDSDQRGRIALGPNSVVKYNASDGEEVEYLKPPGHVMEEFRKNKEESRAGIRRLSGIDPLGGSDEPLSFVASGRARNASFAISEERFLRKAARALERFEKRIYELLRRWDSPLDDIPPHQRLNNDTPTYPQRFNLEATDQQIGNWVEARKEINSDTLDREMQKQISESMLGTIPEEVRNKINGEIENNEIINKNAFPKETDPMKAMSMGQPFGQKAEDPDDSEEEQSNKEETKE